jgi:hypothetical protein
MSQILIKGVKRPLFIKPYSFKIILILEILISRESVSDTLISVYQCMNMHAN